MDGSMGIDRTAKSQERESGFRRGARERLGVATQQNQKEGDWENRPTGDEQAPYQERIPTFPAGFGGPNAPT
jgi:hypothetical protein